MKLIKTALLASRPISWINTAYPFASGYLFFNPIDPIFILGTFYYLIPFNLLMYGVNDVFDYESDISNPRKGSVEGAIVKKSQHRNLLKLIFIFNLPFIIALLVILEPAAKIAFTIITFTALAYSLPKLRFKEIPFLDSITSSSHFTGPLIVSLAQANQLKSTWLITAAFFLWGMASHSFGAIQDILPDKKGKIASIATKLGSKHTLWFSLSCYVLAIILVLNLGAAGIIPAIAGSFYIFNLLPFLAITDQKSGQTNLGWKRFIWLNLVAGALITINLIYFKLYA